MKIDDHEDSFIINLADDSSTGESCDDYDSSSETASEGEWNGVCLRCSVNCFLWNKTLKKEIREIKKETPMQNI